MLSKGIIYKVKEQCQGATESYADLPGKELNTFLTALIKYNCAEQTYPTEKSVFEKNSAYWNTMKNATSKEKKTLLRLELSSFTKREETVSSSWHSWKFFLSQVTWSQHYIHEFAYKFLLTALYSLTLCI